MSALALTLVLLSAVAHSAWNLLLKRSPRQEVFAWASALAGGVLSLPLAVALLALWGAEPLGWAFVAVSGLLNALYYLLLSRAYGAGDLSLVYPVARERRR